LRRTEPGGAARQRRGNGLRHLAGLPRRHAGDSRALPYNIVLVDTVEGFRMMAHGDNDLSIGDKVTARFALFAGRLVPFFARTKS
jgi:hypothetical protein